MPTSTLQLLFTKLARRNNSSQVFRPEMASGDIMPGDCSITMNVAIISIIIHGLMLFGWRQPMRHEPPVRAEQCAPCPRCIDHPPYGHHSHSVAHLLETAPCSSHCGVGAACAAVPDFRVLDTYDTRAPMVVAEQLVRLARGKRYVEIGSRRGDILACVSHYARESLVYESHEPYCASLRDRATNRGEHTSSPVSVRCPELFRPDVSPPVADVYYSWITAPVAWDLVRGLRQAVRAGTLPASGVFTTIVFPLSHYRLVGDNAVYLWKGVELASLASRVHLVPFSEMSEIHVVDKEKHLQHVNDTVAILEFDLAEKRLDERMQSDLTHKATCHGRYSPARCPTPAEFRGALLAVS